jgi:hypothetical protein
MLIFEQSNFNEIKNWFGPERKQAKTIDSIDDDDV